MKLAIGDDFFYLFAHHHTILSAVYIVWSILPLLSSLILFSLMIRKIENEIKNHDNMCIDYQIFFFLSFHSWIILTKLDFHMLLKWKWKFQCVDFDYVCDWINFFLQYNMLVVMQYWSVISKKKVNVNGKIPVLLLYVCF